MAQLTQGLKVICADSYMLEEYAPDKYLQTYAEVEAGMEGYFVGFTEEGEIILDFHGTRVLTCEEDFEDGTFFIPSEDTLTEAKLRQASSKPKLTLVREEEP
jgi:hypothetical protein